MQVGSLGISLSVVEFSLPVVEVLEGSASCHDHDFGRREFSNLLRFVMSFYHPIDGHRYYSISGLHRPSVSEMSFLFTHENKDLKK